MPPEMAAKADQGGGAKATPGRFLPEESGARRLGKHHRRVRHGGPGLLVCLLEKGIGAALTNKPILLKLEEVWV